MSSRGRGADLSKDERVKLYVPDKWTFWDVLDLVPIALIGTFWIIGATLLCVIAIVLFPFVYPWGGMKMQQVIMSEMADWYWTYLMSFIEHWGRWEFVFSGDRVPSHETAIVVSNHRWLFDWAMIMCFANRKGRLGCTKLFAKDSIKYVPGFGWGIYMLGFIFLSRNWANDHKSIEATFKKLKENKLPYWIVSHLEGTRIIPSKLKQSQDFAKKNDLPVFYNVLLPRTKGFLATMEGLSTDPLVKAVYDITIVYNDGRKHPTTSSVICRRGGKVNLHVRRYPIESLPKDEEGLKNWLMDRWKEKEELIEYFLQKGSFPNVYSEPFVHLPMNLLKGK